MLQTTKYTRRCRFRSSLLRSRLRMCNHSHFSCQCKCHRSCTESKHTRRCRFRSSLLRSRLRMCNHSHLSCECKCHSFSLSSIVDAIHILKTSLRMVFNKRSAILFNTLILFLCKNVFVNSPCNSSAGSTLDRTNKRSSTELENSKMVRILSTY